MVRCVGLDAGEYEVKVVELDGSYRKPRLTKANVDRVSQLSSSASDPDHATAEASALQHAVKDAHISKQNICLGFSSREALFRQITVPFTGEDRIRKVIKFEAEGEIHSQSVDDMVIDFHTVEELNDETRVLVAGVPKHALRTTLAALDKVGIDPETVDLDSMALYRVADWCGALAPSESSADSEDADVEVIDGARSRVILNIGARAVVVLVVTDGHLHDMRAIPLGGDSVAEDIAHRSNISIDDAREAVIHVSETGEDFEIERAVDPDAGGDAAGGDAAEGDAAEGESAGGEPAEGESAGGEPAEAGESNVPAVTGDVVRVQVVELARDRFLSRLRREFMRFLVSVKGVGRIEAAYTTGAGSLMAGTNELLADVFGVEPQPLTFMHLLKHDLDEEEVAHMEPRIAVAVGLALSHMNGVKGFNFRQEDLVFTRGFDRIKLPLAIASMLLLFYLFFHGVGLRKELMAKEKLFGYPRSVTAKGSSGRRSTGTKVTEYVQFTGRLNFLVNEGTWPSRTMDHNKYRTMVNQIAAQPTFRRIDWYYAKLNRLLRAAQREGQYEPTLALDSSVAVLQQFAGVVTSVEKKLGRFYIGEIGLKLPTKASGRTLTFRLFIRGDDFRAKNLILERAFEAAFADRKSAFEDFRKTPVQNPVSGSNGVGCYYVYSIAVRDSLPVRNLKKK